mmetsp:Transcript_37966/g.33998  ORF Transcript_37966/g.33998 Transcript_37966/m.33998 type:complete len:171 (+) Transcript_37966:871-1383(+)
MNGDLRQALEKEMAEEENAGGASKKEKRKEYKEIDPTFYYYKRWLWLMFPWICLSFKNNYSKIITECFSSATKYMTVEDERKKTKQALKIALEAKLKKQMVYAKDNNLLQQHMTKKHPLNKSRGSQISMSHSGFPGGTGTNTPKSGRQMLLDSSKLKPKLDSLDPIEPSQ